MYKCHLVEGWEFVIKMAYIRPGSIHYAFLKAIIVALWIGYMYFTLVRFANGILFV